MIGIKKLINQGTALIERIACAVSNFSVCSLCQRSEVERNTIPLLSLIQEAGTQAYSVFKKHLIVWYLVLWSPARKLEVERKTGRKKARKKERRKKEKKEKRTKEKRKKKGEKRRKKKIKKKKKRK